MKAFNASRTMAEIGNLLTFTPNSKIYLGGLAAYCKVRFEDKIKALKEFPGDKWVTKDAD